MLIDGYSFKNFIIKFGKYENLKKLQSGLIYMKDFNYYRSLEKQGQGDKYEGALYSNQIVTIYDGIKQIKVPGFLFYPPNPDLKIPIFCATWVNSKNSELYFVDSNGYGELHIKIDIDRIKEDFDCDYGLIINYEEFQYKIKKYCDDNGISLDQGLVNYYNIHKNFDNPWLKNKINDNDRFYTKDKFFEYQNEVRWVVGKIIDENKDFLIIPVEPFKLSELLPIEKFSDLVINDYVEKVKNNEISI